MKKLDSSSIALLLLIWPVTLWPVYLTITKGFNKPYNVVASWFIWGGFLIVAIGLTITVLGLWDTPTETTMKHEQWKIYTSVHDEDKKEPSSK